jgi:hypothetical protein
MDMVEEKKMGDEEVTMPIFGRPLIELVNV